MTNLNVSKKAIIAILTAGLVSTGALAKQKLVSDALMPGDSDSKWVAGLTVGGMENPLAGDDKDAIGLADINLEYRGETLFLAQDGIGVNLLRYKSTSTGLILSGKTGFLYNDDMYDDIDLLKNVKEREMTADLGMYVIHNMDMGQLRVRAMEEISGKHKGHSADATFIANFNSGEWRINPFVSVAYESKELVEHFYGISADEVTTDLAAYDGDDSVNVSAGINARYNLTANWELGLGASITKLGEGISDSDLIKDDVLYSAAITANYNF